MIRAYKDKNGPESGPSVHIKDAANEDEFYCGRGVRVFPMKSRNKWFFRHAKGKGCRCEQYRQVVWNSITNQKEERNISRPVKNMVRVPSTNEPESLYD
jgi:hypothetical protein